MARQELWIQEAVDRPGRVRRYLARKYGNRAFTSRGTIKPEYLNRAIRSLERSGGNRSLLAALRLAKRLKTLGRKRRGQSRRRRR